MDRTILRNFVSLVAVQGANFILPLLTFPYLLRVLGPGEFGAMAFALAVVTYLVLLADYGFNWSATKAASESRDSKDELSSIYWNVIVAKLLLAVSGAVLLWVCTLLIPRLFEIRYLLLATWPLVAASVLMPQWLFQGLERMTMVSFCTIVARSVTIPLVFIFVLEPSDGWKAALCNSLGAVLAALLANSLLLKSRIVKWVRPNLASLKKIFADGWHLFISTAAVSLYTNSNSVILAFISGPVSVGYFSAADRLKGAALAVIAPLGNSVYPRAVSLMATDRKSAFSLIGKLLFMQGGITLFISSVVFFAAPQIVGLVMGAGYDGAVPVLKWLAFLPFLIGLSNVFGIQTMLPLGMSREFSRILIFSGLLNVSLLLPLAYFYAAAGAAAAVFFTESMVTIIMASLLIRRRIPIFNPRHAFGRMPEIQTKV